MPHCTSGLLFQCLRHRHGYAVSWCNVIFTSDTIAHHAKASSSRGPGEMSVWMNLFSSAEIICRHATLHAILISSEDERLAQICNSYGSLPA